MSAHSITSLPTEVIEKYLLVYLSNNDVYSFGMVGDKRFKQISSNVLENRGKGKSCKI